MHLQFDLLGSKVVFGPFSGNEKKTQPAQHLPTWLTCASQLLDQSQQMSLSTEILSCPQWPLIIFCQDKTRFVQGYQIVLCCSRKWSRKGQKWSKWSKWVFISLWKLWLFHDLIFNGCLGFQILSGNGLIGTACKLSGYYPCVSVC